MMGQMFISQCPRFDPFLDLIGTTVNRFFTLGHHHHQIDSPIIIETTTVVPTIVAGSFSSSHYSSKSQKGKDRPCSDHANKNDVLCSATKTSYPSSFSPAEEVLSLLPNKHNNNNGVVTEVFDIIDKRFNTVSCRSVKMLIPVFNEFRTIHSRNLLKSLFSFTSVSTSSLSSSQQYEKSDMSS